MWIRDYLKGREGDVWSPRDTAEVMRVFGQIDSLTLKLLDVVATGKESPATVRQPG